MSLWELFVIAVGLSMDAFAVSVCKGLSVPALRPVHSLTCGLYFGGFQALMPLLGWLLGVQFQAMITSIDHWIAFVLLGIIGINMIRESREEAEACMDASFALRAMLPLAVAQALTRWRWASPSPFSRSAYCPPSSSSDRPPLCCPR